jgi:hypothetical protein
MFPGLSKRIGPNATAFTRLVEPSDCWYPNALVPPSAGTAERVKKLECLISGHGPDALAYGDRLITIGRVGTRISAVCPFFSGAARTARHARRM